MTDDINRPAHYAIDNIESINIIESLGHGKGFCLGNALKYIHRCERKGDEIKDLKKAVWYLNRRIGQLEQEGIDETIAQKDLTYSTSGTVILPLEGRVAGQVDSPIYNDFYKYNPNEIHGYCASCDRELTNGTPYLTCVPDYDQNVKFCNLRCVETLRNWQERSKL